MRHSNTSHRNHAGKRLQRSTQSALPALCESLEQRRLLSAAQPAFWLRELFDAGFTLPQESASSDAATSGHTGSAVRTVRPPNVGTVAAGNGLTAEYFNNSTFSGTPFTRIDASVNFNWARSAPGTPGKFAVRWTGQIVAPRTGVYTFYVQANGTTRLTIGTQVITPSTGSGQSPSAGSGQAAKQTIASGKVWLTAGQPATLELDYYSSTKPAVSLQWAGPRLPRQVIPTKDLLAKSPAPNVPLTVQIPVTVNAAGPSSVTVSWTDLSKSATGFAIDRSSDGGTTWTTLTSVGPAVTSYTDTTAADGRSYIYSVRGLFSSPVKTAAGTASITPPLAAPDTLAASNSSGAVSLTWVNHSQTATGFVIQRSTDAGSTWSALATIGTVTTYSDTTVLDGATYTYRLEATFGLLTSAFTASAVVAFPLATPTGLTATALSASAITLQWSDNPINATGFDIERSVDGTNFSTITTVPAGATTFRDSGLSAGTTYYYEVRAINASARSAFSAVASAQTSTSDAPSILITPSLLSSMRGKVAANTPQWQSFVALLNSHLNTVMADPPEGNYEGSQLPWAENYALGYQVLQQSDPALAATYADKAVAIIASSLTDSLKGVWGGRALVARGDGVTSQFVLPNTNVNDSTVRVYLAPVYVTSVVHGAQNGQDTAALYAHPLSISNTSDGTPNYTKNVDWQVTGNYRDGTIDWSLNSPNQPATGATYFVSETYPSSVVAAASDGSVYTVSGNTLTFSQPPPANTAIFAEYLYGQPGAGDGGPYKESTSGDGGFNAILYDNGYDGRNIANMAVAMDWLRSYANFSGPLRAGAMAMMVRWSDFLHTNGYYENSPASNYGATDYFARVAIAADAQYYADASTALRLKNEAVNWRTNDLLPAFLGPSPYTGSATLSGGHWSEGWSYAAEAIPALLSAGIAMNDLGWINDAPEKSWAGDVINEIIAEEPTRSTIYDGGDVYTDPTTAPDGNTMAILSATASNPNIAAFGNYMAANAAAPGGGFLDLLFRDPTAPSADPAGASLPLQNLADGTGFMTARKDWSYSSTVLTFAAGNALAADHQTYTQGQITLNVGTNPLLILPDSISEAHATYPAPYGNTLIIGDNGAGTQELQGNQSYYYGPQGVQMTAFGGTGAYAYASGDYANAYGIPHSNPYIRTPQKLTRSVFYIRGQDYLVVYDRADTTDPADEKQLQWWFYNPAQVSGSSWVAASGQYAGDIFSDNNHNGVEDPGERLDQSWPVTMTGTDIYGNPVSSQAWTNWSGQFQFNGVVPGNYTFSTIYGGSVNVTQQSGSKLFGETFANVPITTVNSQQGVGRQTFNRLAVNPATPTSSVRYVSVMQIADASQANAVASSHVTSGDGQMDGTMVGSNVVLFGTNGAISGASSYNITADTGSTVTHYISDLQPGASYALSGCDQSSASASSAGVLTFTSTGTGTLQDIAIAPQ